jgi:hypothetical protein
MKYPLYVLLSIVLSSCFSISKPEEKLTKEEVVAAIGSFDGAWLAKNSGKVDSVLAPGYMYFTPSGHLFIRDSIVATAGSSQYQLSKVERVIVDIKIEGNTAIVNTRWKGKGIYRETFFDDDQRCSITLVKRDKKVSIAAEHCTHIQ